MKLVVTHAFGDKKPGDEITDSDEIAQVLGERPGSVVRVATADAPAAPASVPVPIASKA